MAATKQKKRAASNGRTSKKQKKNAAAPTPNCNNIPLMPPPIPSMMSPLMGPMGMPTMMPMGMPMQQQQQPVTAQGTEAGGKKKKSPKKKRATTAKKNKDGDATATPTDGTTTTANPAAVMPMNAMNPAMMMGMGMPRNPFFVPNAAATTGNPMAMAPPGFIAQQEHFRLIAAERQRLEALYKPQIATLQGQVEKLQNEKSQLETFDVTTAQQKAEKELQKALKRTAQLESRLVKQQAKVQEETDKKKQATQELKATKKKAVGRFNQAAKIVTLEDANCPDILPTSVDIKWQQKYDLLLTFKEEFGHTNCSYHKFSKSEQYPGLAIWVSSQRTHYTWLKQGKNTKLTPHRIALLNKAGFDWQPLGVDSIGFDERIPQLQAFQDEFGHCNVQQQYKAVPGLGNWVLGMRRKHREGKLPQSKIDVLEAMGFQWRLRAVKVPGGRTNSSTSGRAATNNHNDNSDTYADAEDDRVAVHPAAQPSPVRTTWYNH